MHTGLVFNIQRFCLHDGPGIRTTVFLKGCPLRCWWCHNPESQPRGPEVAVLRNRCQDCGECERVCPIALQPDARCTRCGACAAACPSHARQMVGREMAVEEVLTEILKDRVFYDDSGGGATFSGGEPLAQPEFLRALLEACRAQGIHTALDTCGFAPEVELLRIAPLVDLFLYDIKVLDDDLHRQHTGVSNRLILENLAALGRVHHNLWIRVPVVPGFNDRAEQLEAIARLADSTPGVRRVSLLSYHGLGTHKWSSVSRARELPHVAVPSPEALQATAERLRTLGFNVHIGG
jgi:pyruvate formate lyase activating enzyme